MRNAYIANQKSAHGRKALAILPIHYPKELLTALDILSVELWGPPGPPRGPDAGRVQTSVCSIVRNALAFLASGGADAADGVLFPHTCDSIQGLATVAPDMGGWTKPAFTFQHPKGASRPSARTFVAAELRSLAEELAAFAGRPLEPERLWAALRLHREIDRLRAELLDGRARLPMTDPALYRLLRRGEFLWPEEHLAELRTARDALGDDAAQRGVPVMITGYVPEPLSLLEALNDAGAYVCGDDYAAVGRRVQRALLGTAGDPLAELSRQYFLASPCSTRSADQSARLRYLTDLFDRSGARGVIVHVLKFCEPELFDIPAIRRTFAARKVPVLVVEGELEPEISGQLVTRLEAFVELLGQTRRAA